MSHASLIVALSPEQINEAGSVEKAIEFQMAPFNENDANELFADGTRWDWWTIGGRYTGKLKKHEPWKDRDNYKTCWLCDGTGTRSDGLGLDNPHLKESYAGHPVIGEGCNGCGGTGWELKWESDWKKIGNVIKRSELTEALSITAFAFLRDRRWHEAGRLGWWGMEAKTECEIKSEEEGKEFTGRCIHKCPATGAQIVSWNEGDDKDDSRWKRMFWPRFLRGLPADTTLVCVDYHI
jgi:hypothetical protein